MERSGEYFLRLLLHVILSVSHVLRGYKGYGLVINCLSRILMALVDDSFVNGILSDDYVRVFNNEAISLASIEFNHRLGCLITRLNVGSSHHFLILKCRVLGVVFHIIKKMN